MKPTREMTVDKMPVRVYPSNEELGQAAADHLEQILQAALAEREEVAIIVATGNSQLSFIKAMSAKTESIAWDRVTVFHMDEYLGISPDHSASFRLYIRQKLTDLVHPRAFFGVEGDAQDLEGELARYTALLREHKPIACVLGIGENGHLAFNDPPADFKTDKSIHVVSLAQEARQQQVGEGHFPDLDHVPEKALTLTVPALLEPAHVLAVVPEARKAPAVKQSLEGPVTPDCPASLLRTLENVTLYLDLESASQLEISG